MKHATGLSTRAYTLARSAPFSQENAPFPAGNTSFPQGNAPFLPGNAMPVIIMIIQPIQFVK
jgi:hypothetical protein